MGNVSKPCIPYQNHHHQLTVERKWGLAVMVNHCQLLLMELATLTLASVNILVAMNTVNFHILFT